jgi:hypothetical protein
MIKDNDLSIQQLEELSKLISDKKIIIIVQKKSNNEFTN